MKRAKAYFRRKFSLLLAATAVTVLQASAATTTIATGVLVAGGTTSGTTAAIQAAREGVSVVLVESTPWLGGMLTAAGVSATDGNHRLPSGLWGEFRSNLYKYYGGPGAVATGWVSNTQFEPHVGNMIFTSMVTSEDRIVRVHGYHVVKCLMSGTRVNGAVFVNESGSDTLIVNATITIDATETGDLMALSGCKYFIGQDPGSLTGETGAPDKATDIIQDMTYVAILKDYGKEADKTIPEPAGYDPSLYECTCNCGCTRPSEMRYVCDSVLSYGRLPNNKYMINWPYKGNDYYLNDLEMDYYTRKRAWQKAKDHTLGWIYYMQTVAGYKNLGLADDEFPTDDLLALYPYYRESRRLDGVVQLRNNDLSDPYHDQTRPLYKSAISVGDYPLDLHHIKMPVPIFYSVTKISSFSIPYECMISKQTDGLIVAEKSISVSHIANGCTRLQPSVMLIGQAAGCAAALCVKNQTEPRNLNIRELQQRLLDAGCWLLPYVDIKPGDPWFQHVQRVALCGIMRGEGVAEGWANRTYFYPEQAVTRNELNCTIDILNGEDIKPMDLPSIRGDKSSVTRKQALTALWKCLYHNNKTPSAIADILNTKLPGSLLIDKNSLEEKITRKELACWIDVLANPFSK